MRVFWAALAVSLVLGLGGLVALVSATSEYTSTLETYTQLSIRYEPDSFEWVDDDFQAATVRMVIFNESPADAEVENLSIYLRFDGEFAGTNYERLAALAIPKGESRVVTLDLLVSTPSIQSQGGTANLSLDGSATVRFDGISRDLHLRVNERVGVVPAEGS